MALNKDERTYLENTAAAIISDNIKTRQIMLGIVRKQEIETAQLKADLIAMQSILSEKADRNLWEALKTAFKRKRKMDFSFTRKSMDAHGGLAPDMATIPHIGKVKA